VGKAATSDRRWASARPPLVAWHGPGARGRKASTTPGKARQLVAGEVAGQSGNAGQRAAPLWPGDRATKGNGRPGAARRATAGHARLAGTMGKTRQSKARDGPARPVEHMGQSRRRPLCTGLGRADWAMSERLAVSRYLFAGALSLSMRYR
jgi:hypothetical protein